MLKGNRSFRRFIINPHAGKIRGKKKLDRFLKTIKDHFDPDTTTIEFTKGRFHATEITARAVRDGIDTVFSVGGDGTHNEVIHGINKDHIVLGLIPAGSGNDFVLGLRLPKDPHKCLVKMKEYTARQVDLGKVNEHSFLNVMGCGIDADVIHLLEGGRNYASGFYHALKIHRPKKLKLTIDGREYLYENAVIAAVANGLFFGNGMMISPHSKLNDGLLNIIVVHDIKKIQLAYLFPLLYIGQHIKLKKWVTEYKGSNIVIEPDRPTAFQRDGELFEASKVEISVIKNFLNVLVPDIHNGKNSIFIPGPRSEEI